MDTSGNFRELAIGEKPKAGETLISQQIKEFLETFAPKDRPIILRGLTTKNKSSQKRATKKMAKASRQRNRR